MEFKPLPIGIDNFEMLVTRGYYMELRSEGYKNMIKYGISFYEKDCYVKLGEDK